MATISLVMIVKNEEEILENCLKSVALIIDEYVIVDTGSTDSTKDIIHRYGKVYELPFVNFVETKNKAMEFATGDYILWMDADERIYQNLHKLKEYAEQGIGGVSCKITEGDPSDDNHVTNIYDRARMWKNNGKWKFHGPGIHEIIVGDAEPIKDYSILVRHEHLKSDKESTKKDRFEKYVQILEDYIKEYPDYPRAWFYLGRTFRDLNRFEEAISAFLEYLSLPYTFRDERWQAIYDIANCFFDLGEYEKTRYYCNMAISVDNRRAEAYNLIGYTYYGLQDWENSAKYYEMSLKKEIPSDVIMFLNPRAYSIIPMDQLSVCYYNLKKFDEAEILIKILKRKSGTPDKRIDRNLYLIQNKARLKIFMALGQTSESVYGGVLNSVGLHGVESGYIELSREFAKMGHKVSLFCSTVNEHWYDDVRYVPHTELDFCDLDEPDVIVSSRWFSSFFRNTKAKKIIWFRDAFIGWLRDDDDLFNRANIIICNSKWHRNYLSHIYNVKIRPNRIKVIPLGIRKEMFDKNLKKDPYRIIYSSSPDRGLYELLEMWGDITEKVPEVNLDVAYGWDNLFTWDRTPNWKEKIEIQRDTIMKIAEVYDNINFVGRLTKDVLAKNFLVSSLSLYPCTLWETFCVTALEAQAAGTPMVASDRSGLSTSLNRDFNILIEGSPKTNVCKKKFVDATVELLNNQNKIKIMSDGNRNYIRKRPCDWQDIAIFWRDMLWKMV